MRKLSSLLTGVLLLCNFLSHAQSNVTVLEYFFDEDPGLGNAENITIVSPDSEIILEGQSLNTSSLDIGFHTLFVRAKNSNQVWGPYQSKLIYIDKSAGITDLVEISEVEYFIDNDPGLGQGTAINVSAVNELFASNNEIINTSGLSMGFHTLFVRGKSVLGSWGPYESRLIFVDEIKSYNNLVEVSAIEYFIDTDPGVGQGTPINVNTPLDIVSITNQAITTDNLEPGFHTLFLRGKSSAGFWGPYESRMVYVDFADQNNPTPIAKIEYFIDTDPGVGQATNVPITSGEVSYEEIIEINSSSLATGNHTLFVRAQDQNGAWSIYESADFTVYPEVLTENFETGLPPSNNSGTFTLSSGDWEMTNVAYEGGLVNGGMGAARLLANNSSITTPVFSGTSTVSFFFRASGPDDQLFYILKSVDGGAFTQIASQSAGTTFSQYNTTLNEGDASVQLKIETASSGNGADLIIDDFSGAALTPVLATNLYPGNGGDQVDLDSTLAIVFNQEVVKASGNLYVVDRSDSTVVETISLNNTTLDSDSLYFSPANLAYDKQYGIITDVGIVENTGGTIEFNGIRTLSDWAFDTKSAPPIPTEDFSTLALSGHSGSVSLTTGSWEISDGYGEDGRFNSADRSLALEQVADGYFITPYIDGNGTFSFLYALVPSFGESHFEVFKSVDGGPFTSINTGTAGGTTFQEFTINLNHPGSVVQIKVQVNGAISDADLSIDDFQAPFVDPSPSITLLSPNGGENWAIGSTQTITWNTINIDPSDLIEIELSTNGGSTFSIIGDGNFGMFNGEFSWTVTNTASTNAIIRVENTTESVSDQSDAVFEIFENSIASPFTENFDGGTGIPSAAYSGDVTFASGIWQVNNVTEQTSTVISGSAVQLDGLNSFIITPTITGGVGDLSLSIRQPAGDGGEIEILKSTDGGVNFTFVTDAQVNFNTYTEQTFTINETSDVVLKINANFANEAIFIEDFQVTSTPVAGVTVTSPNGGEVWTVGSLQTITWNEVLFNTEDNVVISYSTNGNDGPFTQITTGVPTDFSGAYEWTVPDAVSTTVFVKVENTTQTLSDLSDAAFEIEAAAPNPSTLSENFDEGTTIPEPNYSGQLTINGLVYQTSNVSESSTGGTGGSTAIILNNGTSYLDLPVLDKPQTISFQHALTSGFEAAFWVQKSINGGNFDFVAGDQSNGTSFNSFTFDINEVSDNVVLRIKHNGGDPLIIDEIVIEEPATQPSITLTAPNGGETWAVGSTQTITWDEVGFDSEDNVVISYSTNGNDGPFTQITTGVPTDFSGAYEWTVPDAVSTTVFVKIENTTQTLSDLSDAAFEIEASVGGNAIVETFDTGLPTNYSTGTFTLSTGDWSLTNARGFNDMLDIGRGSVLNQVISPSFANGINSISFDAYSNSDPNGTIAVRYSTDNGQNYQLAGVQDGNIDNSAVNYSYDINTTQPTIIRVDWTSGVDALFVNDFTFNVGTSGCTEGTFLGTVDNDWNNPSNWCGGVIPSPSNVTQDITVSGDLDISELQDFVLNGVELIVEEGAQLTIDLNSNALIFQNGATFVNNGTIIFAQGTQINDPAGGLTNNGRIQGGGTFNNNFANSAPGTLAPGFTPGCTNFEADFTNSGTLEIEIDGVGTACTDYDQITVTGTANLGGTLDIILGTSYTPSDGDEIVIVDAGTLSGTFATVNLPDANWAIQYDVPNAGEVSLTYTVPSLVTGTATSSTGTGFDFSRQETNDNFDAGDYQLDFAFVNNEGVNFGNEGSASLSGTGRRFLLLDGISSLAEVTSIPAHTGAAPWVEVSYDFQDGTLGAPISVGEVWAVYTREGHYAIMEITSLPGGDFGSSFTFDYKYQPSGSTSFVESGSETNYALNFDSVDDQVIVADNASLDITNNITVELWVKPSTLTGYRTYVHKAEAGTWNGGYGMSSFGDIVQWYPVSWSTDRVNSPAATLTLDTWTHLAGTYDGTTSRLYVNGVEVASTAVTGAIPSNAFNLFIGGDGGVNYPFGGDMDEVRIWNVARSAGEISDNMNTELTGSEAGLVAYYKFNDGPGSATLTDLAGTNDGTLTNMDINADWVESNPSITPAIDGFFEDFATEIPANWSTNDATWEDNPALGFEGVQGVARIQNFNGAFLQTPLLEGVTEFSFQYAAGPNLIDGAIFEVEVSTDGVNYTSNSEGTITKSDQTFATYTVGPFSQPQDIYIRVIQRTNSDTDLLVDDFSSDGTAAAVDNTPPNITASAADLVAPNLEGSATVDETGTLYYAVYSTLISPTGPTSASQLKTVASGSPGFNILATGTSVIETANQSFDFIAASVSPLLIAAGQSYNVYYVAEDEAGNLSAIEQFLNVTAVAPTAITFNTPALDDIFSFDGTLPIEFEAAGLQATDNIILELSTDGGTTFPITIANNTLSSFGSGPYNFNYTLDNPAIISSQAVIQANFNSEVIGTSDQFSIVERSIDNLAVDFPIAGEDTLFFDIQSAISFDNQGYTSADVYLIKPGQTPELIIDGQNIDGQTFVELNYTPDQVVDNAKFRLDLNGDTYETGFFDIAYPVQIEDGTSNALSALDFGVVDANSADPVLSYELVVYDVAVNVSSTNTSNYSISLNPTSGFTNSLAFMPTAGEERYTIYVKFNPLDNTGDEVTGDIEHTFATGPVQSNLSLIGREQSATPSIVLISPQSAAEVVSNSIIAIEWGVSNVNLATVEYSLDGGGSWILIEENLSDNISDFSWLVPEVTSNTAAKIRIVDQDNVAATQEVDFTIVPAPEISAISTISMDTQLQIDGAGFSSVASENEVIFPGIPEISTYPVTATTNQLIVDIPTGALSGFIQVNVTGRGSAISPTQFVTDGISFSPENAQVGQTIYINASGNLDFQTGSPSISVIFGNGNLADITATDVTVSATDLLAVVVPEGVSKTGSITVEVNGTPYTSGQTFKPQSIDFSPKTTGVFTSVTVSGVNTNFLGSNPRVFVNGTEAFSVSVISNTQLNFTVPAGATSGKLTISSDDGFFEATDDIIIELHKINVLSVTKAGRGTNVTIQGSNFSNIPNGGVSVNGVTLVNSQFNTQYTVNYNDDEITFTVPSSASGTGKVTVTQGGIEVESAEDFTVIPRITALSLTQAAPGAELVITGSYFSATDNTVYFNDGVPAAIVSQNTSSITVEVPQAATDGQVTVVNNDVFEEGVSTVSVDIVTVPAITGFTPLSAQIGETVTITGENFSDAPVSVSALGAGTTETVQNDNTVTFTVPGGIHGSGDITLTKGGLTITAEDAFTVIPQINSFNFNDNLGGNIADGAVPGAIINIFGNGFNPTAASNTVTFSNGIDADILAGNTTFLRVEVPQGAVTGPVSVTNNAVNTTGTSDNDFVIIPESAIAAFNPVSAKIGETITIEGTNFNNPAPVRVEFAEDNVAQNALTVTGTTIQLTVPSGQNTGLISVVRGGVRTTSAFDFNVEPDITTLNDQILAVGATLRINGTYLDNLDNVTIGGQNATITSGNDDFFFVDVTVPNIAPGFYDVVVNKNGFDDLIGGFEVVPPHTIDGFAPQVASLGGTITVTGTNFDSPNPTSVTLDGVSVSFTVNNATEIELTVPASMTNRGQGALSITRAGLNVTAADDYFIQHAVTDISSIYSATNFVVDQSATISGINFREPDVSQVLVNGNAVAFTINNDGQITFTVPDDVGTGRTVELVKPAPVGTILATETIDIVPRAVLSGINPPIEVIGGNVVITGQNFESPNVSAVSINGRSAEFTIDNATQITAEVPSSLNNFPFTGYTNLIQGDVSISRAGLTETTTGDAFTVKHEINTVSPTTVALGGSVSVSGVFFTNPTTTVAINDGSADLAITNVDHNLSVGFNNLSFEIPTDATLGTNTLKLERINATDGLVTSDPITVVAAHTITDTVVVGGWAARGESISLVGTNFDNSPEVLIQGTTATITANPDASNLTFTVPNNVTLDKRTITVRRAGLDVSQLATESTDLQFYIKPTVVTDISGQDYMSGQRVTITGNNLSGIDQVTVNDLQVDNLSQGETSISFDLTTGGGSLLGAGTFAVKLINTEPVADLVLTLPQNITIVDQPSGVAITEASAPAGATVTITGTGFTNATISNISINNANVASFDVVNDIQIDAVIASNAQGYGITNNIDISVAGLLIESSNEFIVEHQINSFLDASFVAINTATDRLVEGQTIYFVGNHFESGEQISGVTVNGVTASYSFNNDDRLQVTIPAGAGGIGKVSVTRRGITIESSKSLNIAGPPSISGVDPMARIAGGTISITGANFKAPDVDAVSINGAAASFNVINGSNITANVPANATATGDVVITTNGVSTTPDANSTFAVVPRIFSFTSSGLEGSEVTILGSHFGASNATNVVEFTSNTGLDLAASIISSNADQIVALVPTGAITGPIRVTNSTSDQSVTSSANFNLLNSPGNFDINPTSGPVASTFTITGTDLNGVTDVQINGIAATTFDVNPDGTDIQVTVPNAATTGDVIITKAGQDFTAGTFSVTPKVLSFPAVAVAGTTIRINGKTFGGVNGVTVNGAAAAIQGSSTEFVDVLIDIASVGTGDIIVTTPSGSGTSTSQIEVKGEPVIASFTPTIGEQGDQVTITGTDLSTVTFVRFAGVNASFTPVSDTEITATVPGGAETGQISVGRSGVEVFSTDDFQYIKGPNDPPAVTSATATIVNEGWEGNVTTDKASTVYYLASLSSAPIPTSTQVVNASVTNLSNGNIATNTAFVGVDILANAAFSLNTLYDFHFVAVDANSNQSAVFTIENIEANPFITVTAPNGGENFIVGTNRNITWTTDNIPGSRALDVQISLDNGATFNSILPQVETAATLNGAFNWTVPNTLSTEALIQVLVVSDPSVIDASDAIFSIVPQPTLTITNINPVDGIDLLDVNATDLDASEVNYLINGENLLGAINISIESAGDPGFEISADGINYNTTLTINGGFGNIRVRPTTQANNGRTYAGTIVHTSTSATGINVPVTVVENNSQSSLTIAGPPADTTVAGGSIPLRWTASNMVNETVTISLSQDTLQSFFEIASVSSGQGLFTIPVDTISTGQVYVAISATGLTPVVGDTSTFIVDKTPPFVTVDSLLVRNGAPTLTGTVDDIASSITVQIEGFETIYEAEILDDATWQVPAELLETTLADGNYEIIATAVDSLENTATDTSKLELIVAYEALAYEAEEVESFSFVASWASDSAISNYILEVAKDEAFSEPLAGFEQVEVADTFLLIDSEELYHREDYFYRIRMAYEEGGFSENSNVISVRLSESPGLVADSLALVALYEATDGDFWANSAGWFQNNRFDWYGISFDGQRVTGINLSGNDLVGDLSSTTLGGLSAVTTIDLSNNDLTGVPNLAGFGSVSGVDLRENFLDFADLQRQSNSIPISFFPQKKLLEEEVGLLEAGEPYAFDRTIDGTGNQYQWFKDGDELAGQTAPTFNIDAIAFEDEGEYYVEVTNPEFGNVTLTSESIFIFVSSLVQDSLALVSLYDNNGGENWVGVTGWLDDPIAEWSNITIEDSRVTAVDLSGVGIVGDVPTEFAAMASVTSIDLSDNEIDGLPNFTVLENLTNLDVSNNSIEFDAILKNLSIQIFDFSGQAKITVEVEERIREGLDFRLSIDVRGRDLNYQWYFNGQPIPGADSTVYNIIDIDFDQMGLYRCDIQNAKVSAVVPDFALSTGDFEILAIADLGGTIRTLVNEPLEEGAATLYRVRELGTPYDSITTVPVVDGRYNFEGTILGDYLVRVSADLETYFPTYVRSATTWSLADTVRLRRDDDTQYDGFIFFQPPPLFPGPDNQNEIVGILEIDDEDFPEFFENNTNGRTMARRRVRKAGVSFNRARFVNRPEDAEEIIYELIAYTETDENGQFTQPNLPDGDYEIVIEFPGIPMDTTTSTRFTLGDVNGSGGETISLEALITPEGIKVEDVSVTAIEEDYFKSLNIFPNPATDILNITYERMNEPGIRWQVMNLNGQELMSGDVNAGFDKIFQVDVSRLSDGIYLLNFIDPNLHNNNIKTVRFIIRR